MKGREAVRKTEKRVRRSPVKTKSATPKTHEGHGFTQYNCPRCRVVQYFEFEVKSARIVPGARRPAKTANVVLLCANCLRPIKVCISPSHILLKMTTKRCPSCGWEGISWSNACPNDVSHKTEARKFYMQCPTGHWSGPSWNETCPVCHEPDMQPGFSQQTCVTDDFSGVTACVACPTCGTDFP